MVCRTYHHPLFICASKCGFSFHSFDNCFCFCRFLSFVSLYRLFWVLILSEWMLLHLMSDDTLVLLVVVVVLFLIVINVFDSWLYQDFCFHFMQDIIFDQKKKIYEKHSTTSTSLSTIKGYVYCLCLTCSCWTIFINILVHSARQTDTLTYHGIILINIDTSETSSSSSASIS